MSNKLLELLQTYEHDSAVLKELKEELKEWMDAIYGKVTNPEFLPEMKRPIYIINEEAQSELINILRKWIEYELK